MSALEEQIYKGMKNSGWNWQDINNLKRQILFNLNEGDKITGASVDHEQVNVVFKNAEKIKFRGRK